MTANVGCGVEAVKPIAVKYNIDPSNTVDDIVDELRCLIESSRNTLETHSDSLDRVVGGWAALYTLRQSEALIDALVARLTDEIMGNSLEVKTA